MTGSADSSPRALAGAAPRSRGRLVEFLLGPPFARRLALAHAIDDFGDAMVNLSLVGSLFLSVSIDASRSRILVYLLFTAAPLAIAAPLIGNVLDRTRIGYRIAIAGSQLLRAAAALALIGSLLTVALYPLAFVVLVSRKVYALVKSTLVAQMADEPTELLRADTHIDRVGTAAGGLGTLVAGALLVTDHTAIMLVIGACSFAIAAAVSLTLPAPNRPHVHVARVPRMGEAIPARIRSAMLAVMTARAAAGALTYLLAFAIKRGGGDQWIFAAGLLIAGAGGLVANLLAATIHRRLDSDWVIVLGLLVPGFVCALGAITIGDFGVLAIAFSIGLGANLAGRAVTVLNATVPALARGRAIARTQLAFQLANIVGAGLAVELAPRPDPGFAVASAVLIAAGLGYGFQHRRALHQIASRALLGANGPSVDHSLPAALVAEAQRLAQLGAYRMSVVVAAASVDVLIGREHHLRASDAYTEWVGLRSHIDAVRATDEQPDEQVVLGVLTAAAHLVSRAEGEDEVVVAPADTLV